MTETDENKQKKIRKKKSIDEKIEELQIKLKETQDEKRKILQKKGINLWRRIKHLFLDDETVVEALLNDKDKVETLKLDISSSLKNIFKRKKEPGENDGEN